MFNYDELNMCLLCGHSTYEDDYNSKYEFLNTAQEICSSCLRLQKLYIYCNKNIKKFDISGNLKAHNIMKKIVNDEELAYDEVRNTYEFLTCDKNPLWWEFDDNPCGFRFCKDECYGKACPGITCYGTNGGKKKCRIHICPGYHYTKYTANILHNTMVFVEEICSICNNSLTGISNDYKNIQCHKYSKTWQLLGNSYNYKKSNGYLLCSMFKKDDLKINTLFNSKYIHVKDKKIFPREILLNMWFIVKSSEIDGGIKDIFNNFIVSTLKNYNCSFISLKSYTDILNTNSNKKYLFYNSLIKNYKKLLISKCSECSTKIWFISSTNAKCKCKEYNLGLDNYKVHNIGCVKCGKNHKNDCDELFDINGNFIY